MKMTVVLLRDITPVSLRNAWLMRRAWRPMCASPISPSISACGTSAATESTTMISTALLRTGNVLARHGGYLAAQWPAFALGLGGRVGSGRQFVSWISLADHVRATAFLLDSELTGPVNLVAPEPVSNAEFTRVFGSHVHRPTPLPLPLGAVGLVFGREFVKELLLPGQRVRPAHLLDAGFEFEHKTVRQAFAALS